MNANLNKNQYLLNYRKDINSQFGEDGIIEKIFEIIPSSEQNNWCVEFGAWDGELLSNTWNLINNYYWSAVLIECEEDRFNQLKCNYENNPKVTAINKFIHFDGENTLDNVLSATNIPLDFDFISIDIDGNDYHIWDSLRRYKPKLVVIEFNPTIPNDIVFIQAKDFNIFQGSSLAAFVQLAKNKGYELITTTLNNVFFIDKQYFPLMGISDNSIFKLRIYNPEVESRVFTLYDGTVVWEGNTDHSQTGYKIRVNRIQFLPKLLRKYIGRKNKPIIIKIVYYIHRILFK